MPYFYFNKILIFFSVLYISFQSEDDSKALSLFFNKDSFLTSIEPTETMRNLQNNKIYINTQIAEPNQNLKLYLRFNEYITYITDKNYKKGESTSYEFTRKNNNKDAEFTPSNFQTDGLKSGYESKEILKLDKNIIKDFYFILVDKLNNNYDIYESILGLNLPESTIRPVLFTTNFLEQLKNNNLINKRLFSIFYFNKINNDNNKNKYKDYDGQIIFGKLPHELNDEEVYSEINKNYIFNDNNLNWINVEAGDYHIKWKIKFDSIVSMKEQISDTVIEFVIEQNFFTGTPQFRSIINKYFFDEFISKKICIEDKYYSSKESLRYYYYNCDISIKSEFDKYKEDILVFKSKDLNEIFSFKLEELFFEYTNRLFFGVIFDEYQMYGWKLGRLFFEKYPLIFSVDNKAIGYYKQINIDKKNKNLYVIIILVILVILLLIILFIGFRKYNLLKNLIPRKLKANELNDEYSYGNIEDTKKEIITEMATTTSKDSVSPLGY